MVDLTADENIMIDIQWIFQSVVCLSVVLPDSLRCKVLSSHPADSGKLRNMRPPQHTELSSPGLIRSAQVILETREILTTEQPDIYIESQSLKALSTFLICLSDSRTFSMMRKLEHDN